jgi:hypothetical protein
LEIRNEKGYSLLVVLLVVTFIMIISASFITASVTNAKQEKIVDTNNLAVVAAEMGVDYYKTAMLNEFNNRRNELNVAAQSKINSLIARSDFADLDKDAQLNLIRNEIGKMLEGFLKGRVQLLLAETEETIIEGNTKYVRNNLSVKAFDEVVEKGKVVVNGKVTGSSTKENPRELEFKLKFDLLDLSNVDLDIEFVKGIPPVDFEKPSADATICDNSTRTASKCLFDNLEGTTVYFKNGYINPNNSTNNKDFKNSNIFVKGNIDVKNMNGMSNVYINATGEFLAKNFNGKFGINNSVINVGGSMTGENIKVTNSTILINGNFTTGHLDVEGVSKICVVGFLKVNDHLNYSSTSKVIALGGNNKGLTTPSENKFWENCAISTTSNPAVEDNWNDPIIDVEY